MIAPRGGVGNTDPYGSPINKVADSASPQEAEAWIAVADRLRKVDEAKANGRHRRSIALARELTKAFGGISTICLGTYLVVFNVSIAAGVFLCLIAAGLLGLTSELCERQPQQSRAWD